MLKDHQSNKKQSHKSKITRFLFKGGLQASTIENNKIKNLREEEMGLIEALEE